MRDGDKLFTFYWRTGQREVFLGRDPAEALNNAGYGGGALRALDFYSDGDNHDYRWEPATREWITTPYQETLHDQGQASPRSG